VIRQRFVYDSQNRLKQHYHQINAQAEELLSDNTYNDLGQIINKKVGGNLQSIDYSYNIRGWLTGINKPSDLGSDLFGYNIRYTAREGAETPNSVYPEMKVRPLYNGSITEVDWKTSGKQSDGNIRRYGFVYDHLSRMRAGFYQDVNNPYSREYSEYLEYDLNGNITRLNRTGKLQGTSAEVMDDLVYYYQNAESSNRLSYVSETGSGNAGSGYPISGDGQAIAYDGNGNITRLPDKGISGISYNFLNLPVTIQDVKGDKTAYLYSSDGSKLRKTLPGKTVDYLDGFQYENGVLQFFPTEGGYYDAVGSRYVYHYTDHAGNIRLSFTSVNGIASVLEENNYYPFGLKHQQYNTGSSSIATYNYKFGGSELQENGMYDFGARMYMPDLGRWGVMDPLAEIMRSHSPYNYAYNNPVNFIDPDGMAPRRLTRAGGDSPLDYEPSPGLNPNWMGMGDNVGYGDSYGFGSIYSGGGGGTTSSSSTFFNNTFNLGGSWSNTGTGFVSSDNIGLGYDGSYTSLNTALDGYTDLPELTINASRWYYAFTGNYFSKNGKKSIFDHLDKHIGAMATITEWDGDKGFRGNWASSDNALASLSYSMLNNVYLGLQVVDTFNWMGGKKMSGYTGREVFSNIDGSSQFDYGDRLVAFGTTFNPFGPKLNVPATFGTVGKEVLPKVAFRLSDDLAPLSASRFSSLFKGTAVLRTTPATRGLINRYLNKGLNAVNSIGLYRTVYPATAKAILPHNDHNNR